MAEGFVHLLHTYHKAADKGHGRVEERDCWATTAVEGLDPEGRWPRLSGMAMCRYTRTLKGKTKVETRYYITSRKDLDAMQTLEAVCSHWGFEKQLHWVLDIAFLQNALHIRTDNGPENLAVLQQWR